ncbi:MAG: DUF4386 family protein, partial [Pseudomonadota bacterium]|nr:DUF4386 family protein [Pseudomonadota bacterium]
CPKAATIVSPYRAKRASRLVPMTHLLACCSKMASSCHNFHNTVELGIWLTINGLAYMLLSATELLMPEHLKMVSTMTAPILLGEVAFTLWLLIVGARVKAAPATAA